MRRPPWRSLDLSSLDEAGRGAPGADSWPGSRAAFDLGAPPLLRFTADPAGRGSARFILTSHHILMDGWSLPILMQELLTLYAHRGDDAALPRVTPYRDIWPGSPRRTARLRLAAWRRHWRGLRSRPGWRRSACRRGRAAELISLDLSEPLTAGLTAWRAAGADGQHRLCRPAGAILLGRLTGRRGCGVWRHGSGRPPEIAGIETMVGLFINTLPLRAEAAAG